MKTTITKLTLIIGLLLGSLYGMAQSCQSNFSAVDSNCTVYFQDLSSGTNLNFIWLFGDGGSSNAQNPSHTYSTSGTYNVCQIIYDNNNCSDSVCKAVKVNCVSQGNCNATFYDSAHVSNGCVVDFWHTNASNNLQYLSWNWGDGTNGSGTINPNTTSKSTHTYASSGQYVVCLFLWDSISQCSDYYCDTITVNCGSTNQCQAHFVDSAHQGCTVYFHQTSSGTNQNTKYAWNFGDGGTSTNPYPAHTYSSSGWYHVCLTIYDNLSCQSTYCDSVYVNCGSNSNCQAYFIDSLHNGCSVIYYSKSTGVGPGTNYSWNLGDGSTSSQVHPQHTYSNSGWYLVCLTISDSAANCQSTYCDSIYVNCGSNKKCSANFTSTPDGNTPCKINFTNTSSGGSYNQWWWGDGTYTSVSAPTSTASHQYSTSGSYNVCLYLYDSTQQWCDSTCHDVTVNCATGISTILQESLVNVYPNPADDILHIVLSSTDASFKQIKLYDATGRVVYSEASADRKQKITIQTGHFESGVYLLRIESTLELKTERVIIK